MAFIDDHRMVYGVEPIGRVWPIAASTYYEQKARQADPSRLPARASRCGPPPRDHARLSGDAASVRRERSEERRVGKECKA